MDTGFGTTERQAMLVVALLIVWLAPWAVWAQDRAADTEIRRAPSTRSQEDVNELLAHYCVECHGLKMPEADLSLHQLSFARIEGPVAASWKRVLEQLHVGHMPPADAKQPSAQQRRQLIDSITAMLTAAGEAPDASRLLDPSRGNWIDHDALFSPDNAASTATRGRMWRLTGQAYEEFVQSLNAKYRLGFKTYGHTRVRAPWQLTPQEGFGDYAAQHRIGEPEIEQHLRNARRIARAMLAGVPKRDEFAALQVVLQTGDSLAPQQLAAAAANAFHGILGREPSDDELARYAGFLQQSLTDLPGDQAAEQLLIAILFHPELMYRLELPDADAERALIPPRHLARAIAFALTDREPDGALLAAAESGQLASREQIREQVERLLDDDGLAKPRILRFFQEYFGYGAALDVFKDDATRKEAGFRGKNDWHPNFFVSDTDRLIEWIVASDKDVLKQLLTTTKTFTVTGDTKQAEGVKKNADKPFSLFAQTALDIYEIGIERSQWSEERPYDMPEEHRMGILTHPSWLIAHSTNFDNHAIHRGRWIRERLLGGRIPDLPVTVDAQLPDEPDHTLRERMRVTRQAYCWRCHQQMDPLGLPLEQFDHFGRFRTSELEKPVGTAGEILNSGEKKLDGPVEDPFEMIKRLAASERVEQVFVRHAFRYFLGRNETLADGPALVAAHRVYQESGGSLKALIASLLTSDAFLYRTTADNASDQALQTKRTPP